MVDLVTICCFAFVASLAWLLARSVMRLQRDPINGRLPGPAQLELTSAAPDADGDSLSGATAGLLELPFDNGEVVRDLRRAGYYQPYARQVYLAIRNSLVVLTLVVTGVFAVLAGPQRQELVVRILAAGFFAAVVCLALPRVLLAIQAKRRVERIRRGLPDALDMISMCLQGGLPLQDSLSYVGREMVSAHRDLAVELLVVRRQAEMNSLEFAFRQFVDRIDGPEIESLATLIKQNQILGTNVASAVRGFADSIRARRRQLADEQAGKVQLRILFPVILCLVPSVVIVLWGPAILELRKFVNSLEGPMLLGP